MITWNITYITISTILTINSSINLVALSFITFIICLHCYRYHFTFIVVLLIELLSPAYTPPIVWGAFPPPPLYPLVTPPLCLCHLCHSPVLKFQLLNKKILPQPCYQFSKIEIPYRYKLVP